MFCEWTETSSSSQKLTFFLETQSTGLYHLGMVCLKLWPSSWIGHEMGCDHQKPRLSLPAITPSFQSGSLYLLGIFPPPPPSPSSLYFGLLPWQMIGNYILGIPPSVISACLVFFVKESFIISGVIQWEKTDIQNVFSTHNFQIYIL